MDTEVNVTEFLKESQLGVEGNIAVKFFLRRWCERPRKARSLRAKGTQVKRGVPQPTLAGVCKIEKKRWAVQKGGDQQVTHLEDNNCSLCEKHKRKETRALRWEKRWL